MSQFDVYVMVDWSAASKLSPDQPSENAIWIGTVRKGATAETKYFRGRKEAEAFLFDLIAAGQEARQRTLIGFDFPFGYPAGFAEKVTGSSDPFVLWDWFADRITDTDRNENNRFEVAEEINAKFEGLGPLWGKSHPERWPGVPYRKEGIIFDSVAEKRVCDRVANAASSCFQLFYNPTVGSQVMMGLPMLSRLRRIVGVSVWPFECLNGAQTVLAEIWPGLIEPAVQAEVARGGAGTIRDEVQVRLLAEAFSQLPEAELAKMMQDPDALSREEAWILGAGHRERLSELAAGLSAPTLNNDCFALPQGVDWTPVSDALGQLKESLTTVVDLETVSIAAAVGRVAATDLFATRSNPPLPNTAVDGYGFSGGRGEGAHFLPLAQDRAAAGDAPKYLPEGMAIRVLTGAALPDGVDTVVLEEDVTVRNGKIAFRGPIRQGANTRRAGEDKVTGDRIVSAGARLGPAELALMSATGISTVAVRRPLKVAVISTGSELVEAGEHAKDGQIFDANRPMLLALVRRFGHEVLDIGRIMDDRDALAAAFDEAAASADVVITSGGASAGDEDHVSALLTQAGAMNLWRVAVKPGRPLALGMWRGRPVFGLPGNPVAAMVCTLIFARPALAVLAGETWPDPQGFMVPAAFSKNKKEGRSEFLRARTRDGKVEVFPSEGSGRISGLAWAEGLVELPPEAAVIEPGVPVRYIPFGSFGL